MWRPNESIGDDVSGTGGIDPRSKRRRSRRRVWRDGLADQTVVSNLEDVRSYRAFERVLIGSVDPRSVIELALIHRLASLLWRLRRAGAIETGLFELQGEALPARRPFPVDGVRLHHGRTLALLPNVSCAFAVLTQPCLIAWPATKRDYGARPRKRFGPSRRCDSRRLQCGSGCATGSRASPGIGRGSLG